MAIFAQVAGADVARIFTGCGSAVMTGSAICRDAIVIEVDTGPVAGGMTVVALVSAGDMLRRFTTGHLAVMTTAASALYRAVIHA